MTDDETTVDDILSGSNIRDAYDAETVREVFVAAEEPDRTDLRMHLRRQVDDGRFWDFLDEAHSLLAKSDLTRRQHFADNTDEWLIQWVATFGVVENLNTFPRLSGVESPL